MASKPTQTAEEEPQQLLRTVEMFEAITQSQPDDYQSLEILKETYTKLGRQDDSLRISKKLAAAYASVGQISQAVLEYEGILQKYPGDAGAVAALAQLEPKTSTSDAHSQTVAPSLAEDSKPTPLAGAPAGAPARSAQAGQGGDGDRALADVLIAEKLVTPQAVEPLLERLKALRNGSADKSQPLSLAQLIANEQIAKLDDVLSAIIDKSRLPYLPLSSYDVDRDIVYQLPQDVCWQTCVVPVDLISRSILIATANPFDHAAKKQVESILDYNVFWYISPPAEILAALRRAHGLDNNRSQQTKP